MAFLMNMQCSNFPHLSPTKLEKSGINYERWRIQMLHLIHRQGLLCFIDGTNNMPSNNDPGYPAWRRTDLLVKQGILNQLDDGIVFVNVNPETARAIWMALPPMFPAYSSNVVNVAVPGVAQDVVRVRNHSEYATLYKASVKDDWGTISRILGPNNGQPRITTATTALHIAVGVGGKSIKVVKNLVEFLSSNRNTLSCIGAKDAIGDTALNIAAAIGNIAAAKILVDELDNLPFIPNNLGIFPVHAAAIYAQKDMLKYLNSLIPDPTANNANPYDGESGLKLLISVIEAGFFDIAQKLVVKYPDLATREVSTNSALKAIAAKMSAVTTATLQFQPQFMWILSRWTKNKIMCDRNTRGALKLVKCLCEKLVASNPSVIQAEDMYRDAILIAAQSDNHEIVREILKFFPNAIHCFDPTTFKSIFHVAVENRSERTLKLVYYKNDDQKQLNFDLPDIDGNNLLHLAAKLAPSHKLSHVSNATIQMQYEVLWYKRVENLVHGHSKARLNYARKSPKTVFVEEHENMRQQGAKWIKDTNNACIVAATLICSIMFAASITVPGGNDSSTGFPLLYHRPLYWTFRQTHLHSLVFSVVALLLFLITSSLPYTEKYFLYLPTLLYLGLACLVTSITFMMQSFFAAFRLNAPPGSQPLSMQYTIMIATICSGFLLAHLLWGVFHMPIIIITRAVFGSLKKFVTGKYFV